MLFAYMKKWSFSRKIVINKNEGLLMTESNYNSIYHDESSISHVSLDFDTNIVAPFFSMRKLRLVYNQLSSSEEFEFVNFESFKHQVLNSVAPQLELNKWQAIAARR